MKSVVEYLWLNTLYIISGKHKNILFVVIKNRDLYNFLMGVLIE